jgi:hypothetical protein
LQIQVNSDKNITVDAEFTGFVRDEVNRALARFKDKLTRVEVHLSDVNSLKFGKQDKRCMVEARPAGHRPLVTTMSSANIDSAVRGSLNKLRTALDTLFARTGKARKTARPLEPVSTPARTSGRKAASKKRTGRPAKRSAGVARKSPKRATAKKTSEATETTEPQAVSGRGPKKKGIYRARRKAWPKR